MKYTTEITQKIFNDDTGTCITVGPDDDGVGNIQISNGEANISFESKEQARRVAESILNAIDQEWAYPGIPGAR